MSYKPTAARDGPTANGQATLRKDDTKWRDTEVDVVRVGGNWKPIS
ncbi:MAG: hypothetical protein WAN86_23175 [Hyphomicrobiaceae bacterium]